MTPIEGRRLRAALAHSDLKASDIWNQLNGEAQASTTTLDRWKKNGIPSSTRAPVIERLAELCDLPEAFFYADFSKLPEIVPATNGKFGRRATDRGADRAAGAEARQAAERLAGPPAEERRRGPQDRRSAG